MNTQDMGAPNMVALKTALKMVIADCKIQGVNLADISDHEPLVGGATLPLDSLDAVEIVTALERNFDIRLESAGASRQLFKSFDAMADYVVQNAIPEKISAFVSPDKK